MLFRREVAALTSKPHDILSIPKHLIATWHSHHNLNIWPRALTALCSIGPSLRVRLSYKTLPSLSILFIADGISSYFINFYDICSTLLT